MLFPTVEPAPSGPWHIAHFARNVALLAALSGAGFARAIETTKSVRPTKIITRNIEAINTFRSVLSFMTFPLLAIFSSSSGHFPIQQRIDRQLKPSFVFGRYFPLLSVV